MKVLSFDVGIKNLAYCLLDTEDTQSEISDWGILNISVEPVCEHQMKGKCCDKTAKFTIGDVHLCPAHRNLKVYREQKAKKVPKIKNSLLAIGKNIVRILEDKPHFLESDVVLIENQPALKNPTMKSIQMMVYSYFLVRGLTVDEYPLENMEMINARNKLKAYKGPAVPCIIQDKYKRTKFLGIEYCKHMIHNSQVSETFREMFTASKKKDDLADSYLQGQYWIQITK